MSDAFSTSGRRLGQRFGLVAAGTVAIALAPPFGSAAVAGQPTKDQPRLRIVVLEGEDALNIIQQKTAVMPVVEVRDRND